jgi:hypothetical protein
VLAIPCGAYPGKRKSIIEKHHTRFSEPCKLPLLPHCSVNKTWNVKMQDSITQNSSHVANVKNYSKHQQVVVDILNAQINAMTINNLHYVTLLIPLTSWSYESTL